MLHAKARDGVCGGVAKALLRALVLVNLEAQRREAILHVLDHRALHALVNRIHM